VARRPEELDLEHEACRLEVNGEAVDSATRAAVRGHPVQALAQAANSLARQGIALERGWLLLPGGLTGTVSAQPRTETGGRFTTLGAVTLSCV